MFIVQNVDDLADELGLEDACGRPAGALCRLVYEQTDSKNIAAVVNWLLQKPLSVVFIVAIAMVATRLLKRAIDKLVGGLVEQRHARTVEAQAVVDTAEIPEMRLEAIRAFEVERASELRAIQRARTVGTVLRSAGIVAIWGVAAIMIIAEFGVALGPLVAGAGIAGIALGFGAQSLVRDILSGMFMLIEDQYGVGDVVDLGEPVGVVEEVQLRITKVRGLDGRLWYVPNGEIKRVANLTQLWARVVLDVEVAYHTDLDHAIELIQATAEPLLMEADQRSTILDKPVVAGVDTSASSPLAIRLPAHPDAPATC